MADLPEFLQFKRYRRGEPRPRRTMESRVDEEPAASGVVPPGDGPNNTPAPAALSTPETQPEPPGVPATRPRRVSSSSGMEQAVEGFLQKFAPKPDAPVEPEHGALAASVTELPTQPVPRIAEHAPEAFEPSRVPVTGKARALPAPGEMEANDARVRDLIGAAGGFDEAGAATGARERITDPTGRLEKQIEHERQHLAQDTNGRAKSGVKLAARMFLDNFPRGGLGAGVRGAVAGGVLGVADPASDERYGQQRRAAGYQRELAGVRANEKAGRDLEEQRASTRLKNEQADHWAQRPDADRRKALAAEGKAEQARIFRVLSSLKGQKLDPANPRHAKLIADADAAGIPVDPDSFNASKGNVVRYPRVDPANPSRTQVVERNLVTGEETVLGQAGYVAPRDASGMTAAEVKAAEDRDRAFGALQEHRAATLGLATDRLREQMLNGLSGRASREFTTATKGTFERRKQLDQDIEALRKRAASYLEDPKVAAQRIAEMERERDGLTERIEAERTKALGAMSGAPGSSTSGARPGRFSGQRMPRANLPAAAKSLGLSEQDAEALIVREGGVIY